MVPDSKWQVSNLSLRTVNKEVVKSRTWGGAGTSCALRWVCNAVTCILTIDTQKGRGQRDHKGQGWRGGHKSTMA